MATARQTICWRMIALIKGDYTARWLSAATLDRYKNLSEWELTQPKGRPWTDDRTTVMWQRNGSSNRIKASAIPPPPTIVTRFTG